MDVDNMFIAKNFEKEMNNLVKQIEERHLANIYIYNWRVNLKKNHYEGFFPTKRCDTEKISWGPWSFDCKK